MRILRYIGVSPSGKAHGFGPCIRGFESLHPSQVELISFLRFFFYLNPLFLSFLKVWNVIFYPSNSLVVCCTFCAIRPANLEYLTDMTPLFGMRLSFIYCRVQQACTFSERNMYRLMCLVANIIHPSSHFVRSVSDRIHSYA